MAVGNRVAQELRRRVEVALSLGPGGTAREIGALVTGAARSPRLSSPTFAVDFPIDVVYTWVDGADPQWQERRDAAWASANPGEHSRLAANASRYVDREELRYSLRSLVMNANWVRTIHIVTDRQVPSWLDRSKARVRIVDHREIFADENDLPTFNSHAIESRLHHIPDLAECYLYLNDDMFFGRACAPTDFFYGNGLARLFPSPKAIPNGAPTPGDTPVEAAGKNNRALLQAHFGRTASHRFLHVPYPQLRSLVTEMEAAFRAEFARTAGSRFRHPADISIPASLVGNYAYFTAHAVPGTLSYGYLDLADPHLERRLKRVARSRPQVFCLNDHAGLGADPAAVDASVRAFLSRYFPRPSPFEQDAQRP